MIGIYKIQNLINQKCYIGQSIDIERRWRDEKRTAFDITAKNYNYPISQAFRKYGLENFSFEVIEECFQSELNQKERYWINYYNSFFNGYNQTLGGDSSKTLEISKENIIGIFNDLKTTDMYHREIAEKWNISIEMVQGINTGRYWFIETENYPLQKLHKGNSRRGLEKKIWYCQDCGKEISKGSNYCKDCWDKHQRKVSNRPNREELKQLIRTTPFIKIGQQFGVSDNTIRKWCKAENLPFKSTEIKKISNEDWILL